MKNYILLFVGLACAGCSTDSDTIIQSAAETTEQPQSLDTQPVAVDPTAPTVAETGEQPQSSNTQPRPVPPTASTTILSPNSARMVSPTVIGQDAKQIEQQTNVSYRQQVVNIGNAIKSARTQAEFDQISSTISPLSLEYKGRFEAQRKRESEGKVPKTGGLTVLGNAGTDLRIAGYMGSAMEQLEEARVQRTKGTIQMSDARIGSALYLSELAESAEQKRNNPELRRRIQADTQRQMEDFRKGRNPDNEIENLARDRAFEQITGEKRR